MFTIPQGTTRQTLATQIEQLTKTVKQAETEAARLDQQGMRTAAGAIRWAVMPDRHRLVLATMLYDQMTELEFEFALLAA